MPIVLVELPAADAADVNASALVAACSSGLRRGSCVVEEPPSGERATAVAIVVWLDPDHLRARIDVGRRAEERAGWQVRELSFHEQDAPLERWRSVGLAIAGIVGEATLFEPARAALPEPARPKPGAQTTASPSAPREPRVVRIALGPALETGLAERPSVGAWLDVARRCCGSVPLELAVTASNAWSARETAAIATRFSTLGAGLGVTLHVGDALAVRAAAFVALGAVDASATDPATGAHASKARWLPGGLGRVQAIWPATGALSGVLGLEITQLSSATELKLFGQRVATSAALRAGVQAGLEWKFWISEVGPALLRPGPAVLILKWLRASENG